MSKTLGMINNIYTIIHPIKHGSFGSVFLGKNTITDDPVAIKIDCNVDSIQHETAILQYLAAKDCRVVPPVFNYGRIDNGRNYLVMPYYESSLADYLQNGPALSPEHAKEILVAMFEVLKQVHRRWVVHRDIKPGNFMIRSNGSLVLIDFGMATYYMVDSKTHVSLARHVCADERHVCADERHVCADERHVCADERHVCADERHVCADDENHVFTDDERHSDVPTESFIGSRRYASINVHLGYTPSRRDDLISAAYIYVVSRWPEYMYSVVPPFDKKQLHNLPEESRSLFKYLYGLSFMESPDYSMPDYISAH
jgi:serine/threonine protein kinase